MKKLLLLVPILAAVVLFARPVLAEDVRQSGRTQAAQEKAAGPDEKMDASENMMQESMKKMQAQMAAIHQTKDPKKRQKLLQEHSKSMRESIKMLHETMGGMAMGCPMMGGGHMMGGNPAGQAGGNAGAAPAAPQANPGQPAASGKTSTDPEGKLWVCPMHPDVVRDKPGTCPICGMDLVEKGQAGAAQSGHDHMMGGCMMGGMKGGCMMGGGGGCMMGHMGCPMMGMAHQHMGMMLMLMEQMIEHDEAAMAARK